MSGNKRIDIPTISKDLQKHQEDEWVDHGDDIDIRCAACDALLVSLVVTRPNAPVLSKIVVKCCDCGDKSFIKVVKGIFAIGTTGGKSMENMVITNKRTDEDGFIHMDVDIYTRSQ